MDPELRARLNLDPAAAPTGPAGGAPAAPAPAPAPAAEPSFAPDLSGFAPADLSSRPDLAPAPGAAPTPAPAAPGAPAPATPAPAATPTDPNLGAGGPAAPAAPAAAPQWQGVRDAATGLGFAFGQEVTSDQQALLHLVQLANAGRQSDYYAQLGRRLAPHAPQIQTYLQQQQAPAAPAARPAWEPPPFDDRWLGLVQQDPTTGIFVGKPGAPAHIVDSVNEYANWKQAFDRNPAESMNQMVEARATAIVDQRLTAQFEARDREGAIQQIASQNDPWLYQRDASGRRMVDAYNRPIPSPAGAAYLGHLQTLHQMGVRDVRAQNALAIQLLQGQIAAAQAPAAAPNPQTAAATYQPQVNPLGATPPAAVPNTPGAVPQGTEGLSLIDIMRRDFAQSGITDADILASIGGN